MGDLIRCSNISSIKAGVKLDSCPLQALLLEKCQHSPNDSALKGIWICLFTCLW